jgi:CubicO group peptidase (beta-lactamase class C family)
VPARPRYIDQPWGHRWKAGVPEPVPPGTDADNPSGLGPAGTVHLTLGDLLRYGAFHADSGRRLAEGTPGAGRVLGPADFQALHEAPEGESDAFGWRVVRRDWGGGTVLTHTGSNTQWFAVLWVAPAMDVAIAAVTNIGDDDGRSASKATDEAVAWLVRRHLVPRP